MASQTEAGTTPANVADLATLDHSLNRRNLTLLGVFGTSDALTALVRLPSGRIQKVKSGDKLANGVVAGIDMDGLMLTQFGKTRRLPLDG